MDKKQLRAFVTVIANMVYGYNGSDPNKPLYNEGGIGSAMRTLNETIKSLLSSTQRGKPMTISQSLKERIITECHAWSVGYMDEMLDKLISTTQRESHNELWEEIADEFMPSHKLLKKLLIKYPHLFPKLKI